MARYRQKQLRYGISSGAVMFAAGWAVIALILPSPTFGSVPRWKSTLWVYLGTHLVHLSNVYSGGLGFRSVDQVSASGLPVQIYLIPVIAVAIAAGYTCYELRSTRLKHNVANALAAGTGYFLTGLVAMVVSDIRPAISTLLILALVVGGGIWVGSTLLGFLSRGLPFFGVASLGTIVSLGVLVVLGGIAILTAIQGLVVMAFGAAAVVGISFGVSRQLERRGRRYSRNAAYPRIRGLQYVGENYWKQILALAIVAAALVYGLSGNAVTV